MSILSIRQSLELGLNSITPVLDTAWENVDHVPVTGTPYQQVFIKFATPDNIEYGSGYRELGYMQINLMYPVGVGTSAIDARAVMIRAKFARTETFVDDGIKTTITKTPVIYDGFVDGDRYRMTIRIPFHVNDL